MNDDNCKHGSYQVVGFNPQDDADLDICTCTDCGRVDYRVPTFVAR